MKQNGTRDIGLSQIVGFAFVSLFGTLLHFLYDWTENRMLALFSSVNESTWEHMKILFFPLFIFAVVQSLFVGKGYENFFCIKLKGTLLGLILIPVLFYTLRGIFGTTPDFVNIAIFFLAAAIAYLYEARLFKKGSTPCAYEKWVLAALCLIAVAFCLFTFMPLRIPLFEDPIDGSYGLKR